GAAGRSGRTVYDVQDVRSILVPLVQTEIERRERKPQRIVGALALVRRPEERIALVEDRAAPQPALALTLLAERAATSVVHERRVLHEMPVTQPRRAQAQVDFLAVSG